MRVELVDPNSNQTVMRHRSHPRRTAVPCRDWMLTWRVFSGVVIGSIRYTSQLA